MAVAVAVAVRAVQRIVAGLPQLLVHRNPDLLLATQLVPPVLAVLAVLRGLALRPAAQASVVITVQSQLR